MSARATARSVAGLLVLAAALRLVGLERFPLIAADEGGWPLSVRNWVESGLRSPDYFMAPGYHWLLGAPFGLFGAIHTVARPVSVAVSLFSLFLFYRLAARLTAGARRRPVAVWATLLLATSYPAILTDRRALIEPFQIALMTGLALAAVWAWERPTSPARWLTVAAITALLLLTKASALFVLPALVWAAAAGGRPWRDALATSAALGAGLLTAACVFGWLYWQDPAGFAAAWGRNLTKSNVAGAGAGRFAFNPTSVELTLRWLAEYEPVLSGCSLLALLKAVCDRRQTLMAAWYLSGLAFVSLQQYVLENHRAPLVAPMCFLTAWLLGEFHQAQADSGPRRPRLSWAGAMVLLLSLYGVARTVSGIMRTPVPDSAAVEFVKTHADRRARVMAAPYVLMRLASRPVAFWSLGVPFEPRFEALRRLGGADWIVVDPGEWRHHHAETSRHPAALDHALRECCQLAFGPGDASGTSVYRVLGR